MYGKLLALLVLSEHVRATRWLIHFADRTQPFDEALLVLTGWLLRIRVFDATKAFKRLRKVLVPALLCGGRPESGGMSDLIELGAKSGGLVGPDVEATGLGRQSELGWLLELGCLESEFRPLVNFVVEAVILSFLLI